MHNPEKCYEIAQLCLDYQEKDLAKRWRKLGAKLEKYPPPAKPEEEQVININDFARDIFAQLLNSKP